MVDLLPRLLPIVALFVFGVFARHRGWFDELDARRMLTIVLWFAMPALILGSVTTLPLEAELMFLPVAGALILVASWPVAVFLGTRLGLSRPALGVFVISPMVMNLAAEYPFVLAVWGAEGFGRFALFDLGNSLVVFTLTYALACLYGGRAGDIRSIGKRLATFPPLWALAVALLMNRWEMAFPATLVSLFNTFGSAAILLIMISLGIHFRPRLSLPMPAVLAIALRVVFGAGVGLALVGLFDLRGLDRTLVLMGAIAPVGFNVLVFAAREGLDSDLAASIVSVSLLLGFLYLPLFLYVTS
ncbi:MAG: AEC family transporter [Gammaproteobacteria bacterium]